MLKALPIFVAIIAIAGCGISSPEPQTAAAVASAYRSWDNAGIKGDAATACSRMTARFVKFSIADVQSKAKDCAGYIKETAAYVRRHPEMKNFKISDVVVDGNTATLIDTTPSGKSSTKALMMLVREIGRWKVDAQSLIHRGLPKQSSTGGQTT